MTDLYLYVDNEDSTGSWSTTGTTPYLSTQNQPTDYISSTSRNADSGVYSFPSSGKSTETINSVTLYIYAYGVATSDFEAILSSSATGLGPPAGSWQWVSIDVSSILTTWAQIDAATVYFDRPNTTNDAGVDCCYLLVDYTSGTTHQASAVLNGSTAVAAVAQTTLAAQATLNGSATVAAVGSVTTPEIPWSDGFETGDTSQWTSETGTVTVNTASALEGTYGVEVPGATATTYVTKDWTNSTNQYYWIRIRFDLNDSDTAGDGAQKTFVMLDDGGVQCAAVALIHSISTGLHIRIAARDDAGVWDYAYSDDITGSDPMVIEAEWDYKDTDGTATLWIDGEQVGQLTGIDSGTYFPDAANVGARFGVTFDTGSYYLDSFEIYDTPRPKQGTAVLNGASSLTAKPKWTFPFFDGFESGDYSKWDSSNGTPTINGTAAIDGSYGFELPYNHSGQIWTELEWTNTTHQVYRVKFKFDCSTITHDSNDWETLVEMSDGASDCVAIELQEISGSLYIKTYMRNDADDWGSGATTSAVTGEHEVEVEFHFQNTDGYALIWLDGTPQTTENNRDTGTRFPDFLRFGTYFANPGNEFGSGSIYLDSFFLFDYARPEGQATLSGAGTLAASGTVTSGTTHTAQATLSGSATLTAKPKWSFPFFDGFESGDVSAWDSVNGTPTINGTAALDGSYGYELAYNDTSYVVLEWVNSTERVVRVKFKIDPNSIVGDTSDNIRILDIYDNVTRIFSVTLRQSPTLHDIYISGNGFTARSSTISDAPHTIEVEVTFGAGDAQYSWWLDDVEQTGDSSKTSDFYPDEVRFGFNASAAPFNSGSIYLDSFFLFDYARPAGQATLSGAGTVTAAGTVEAGGVTHTAQAQLDGAGTLTGVAAVLLGASATLDGSASLTAVGVIQHEAQATLSGSATVAAAGSVTRAAAATLDGSSSLTAVGVIQHEATATLSGTASVVAAGAVIYVSAAQLDGVATLVAVATIEGEILAAAVLDGSSSVVASGAVVHGAVAQLDGTAALSGTGTILGEVVAAAVLNGSSSVTATGVVTFGASATLSGSATLTGVPSLQHEAQSQLDGSSSLTASGVVELGASAQLDGSSSLTAYPTLQHEAQATLSGVGTLSADSVCNYAAQAQLDGSATIVAVGTVQEENVVNGAAVLDGSSNVTVAGVLEFGAQSILAGVATVGASGSVTLAGIAVLNGSSTVTAVGVVEAANFVYGVATLSGDAIVVVDGSVILVSASQLDGTSSVIAFPSFLLNSAAVLDGTSSLVGVPSKDVVSSAILNGTSTTTGTAHLQLGASVTIAGTSLLVADAAALFGAQATMPGVATLIAVATFRGAVYETIGGPVQITFDIQAPVQVTYEGG